MHNMNICPYPGLRPFNENEAIFFKGRDRHIEQVVAQLEQNKFIMLTGASGDGKSSLVYAGVIPNAQAGFFKAKFNNWILVDFRPERDPLKNLSKTLSHKLNINDDEKTEKELSFGFSSLIKLYKSSPFYIDTNADEYKKADVTEQKKQKRKAANLIILADQFEEFFTNIENFSNEVPSLKSQTVVNLLLETAKIALAEDIPIYIICTMRSDYIGQCAAFHGLPEYIGFSQFFVPRLKRKEIQQVIEEPAMLSGCKISNRLTQILINELGEGIDQLPVLQHGLNQIWHKANDGNDVMDIIHLAKLGGMPPQMLSAEDQLIFEKWFNDLPSIEQNFLKNPSLENLLNAHANELHDRGARLHYNKTHKQEISESDAALIIKTAFQCLTRIDHSRAVRNRMTLQEINDIINKPSISTEMVAGVLDIFRVEGNTFLKPFITEDPESLKLNNNDVLDITHESLIRNWKMLMEWALEENSNYTIFLDFEKQLNRWVDNDKSSGYLLPIGPLTYFEHWINECNPNKYWLKKYDDSNDPDHLKLKKAETTINNARQFIKRSARKLFVSRTILKYGADRVAAVAGLIALVFICTFYYFDYRKKQNDYVLNDIIKKGIVMMKSDKIKPKAKANFLNNYERLHPFTAEKILDGLQNDSMAYDVAYEDYGLIQNYDGLSNNKIESNLLLHRLFVYMDSSLTVTVENGNSIDTNIIRNIKRINNFLKLCTYEKYYKNTSGSEIAIRKNLLHLEKFIELSLENPKTVKTEDFNISIELLLTCSHYEGDKIKTLIQKISPFTETGISNFNAIYPKDEKIKADFNNYLSHKGGYQILSYLNAAAGDFTSLARCLDSITINNTNYKNYFNESMLDLTAYLVKYQDFPSPETDVVINKYLKYSSFSKNRFYQDLATFFPNLRLPYQLFASENFFFGGAYYFSLIKFFKPLEKFDKVWDYHLTLIKNEPYKIQYEKEINEALFYKKRGIFATILKKDKIEANKYFDMAVKTYQKIPSEFLTKDYVFYNQDGQKNNSSDKVSNSSIFLYPNLTNDFGQQVYQFESDFMFDYFPFFDYVLANNLGDLYKTDDQKKVLEKFIYQYLVAFKYFRNVFQFFNKPSRDYAINYNYFNSVVAIANKNSNANEIINKNFIDLILINKDFDDNDTISAFKKYAKLDLNKILDPGFQKQEQPRDMVNQELMKQLAKNLAVNNRFSESFKLLTAMKDPWEKRNGIIDICYSLQSKGPVENTFVYLDSLFKEVEKKPKFGMKLFRVMGMVGSQEGYDISMDLFKEVDDLEKPRAIDNFINGIASDTLYYKAYTYIPEYLSRDNQLELYNEIIHAQVINNLKENKTNIAERLFWKKYEDLIYGEFIPEDFEVELEHFLMFAK